MDKWIGAYHLIDFIDPGGTSAVFRAHYKESEDEVAIKIMSDRFPQRDPVPKEKFLKEVEILETLDHEHIVKLIDVIFQNTDYDQMSRPCIVMPYVPGGTLRKLLKNDGLLPLGTIRSYTRQIAEALSYAHSRNIMHCDVKPENILLSEDGSTLFLADFGIAQILSEIRSTTHMTTTPSGTPNYMAPEQFVGNPSRKSDQYALAVLLYECLCGSRPFEGNNYDLLNEQHRRAPVPSLQKACRTRGRNISKITERVILKALAKEKEKRYPSIQDFASDLDRAIARDIAPKPLIKSDEAYRIGAVIGILVGIGMLIVYLTASVDMPPQFSIGEKTLSNFLEFLYIVCALLGLGSALASLIRRKSRYGIIALSCFLLVPIFFLAQFFLARPLFTLVGQLRLLGFFSLIPVGFIIGILLASGVGSLFIWYANKRRQL